jgi:hypothetical protein
MLEMTTSVSEEGLNRRAKLDDLALSSPKSLSFRMSVAK